MTTRNSPRPSWQSAFLLAVALASPCAAGTDWPCWRGPHRNGISTETGLNWNWPDDGPKRLWKATVAKGFSSVVVSQGKAYTMGNRDDLDMVFCLDAHTGKEIWRHTYACLLDPKSFEGGPLATPAVEGHRVYTLSKFGDCFCLDAQTGQVLWSRKFSSPLLTKADYHVWWGFAGSIVILEDRLILPIGKAGTAVDKLTGDILWQSGSSHPGYATPALFTSNGRPHLALAAGHELVAADVQTGNLRWTIPWKTTWDQNASDLIVSDGKVFASSGHQVGCALFDISGEQPVQLWRNQHLRVFLGSPILWNGALYGFDDRHLTSLDWATGTVHWSVPDLGLGTLILAEGKLIALTEKGKLIIARATPQAYQALAQVQVLGGRCWSTPSLADGRLYPRNAAGDLVCLDLKSDPDR